MVFSWGGGGSVFFWSTNLKEYTDICLECTRTRSRFVSLFPTLGGGSSGLRSSCALVLDAQADRSSS